MAASECSEAWQDPLLFVRWACHTGSAEEMERQSWSLKRDVSSGGEKREQNPRRVPLPKGKDVATYGRNPSVVCLVFLCVYIIIYRDRLVYTPPTHILTEVHVLNVYSCSSCSPVGTCVVITVLKIPKYCAMC